MKKIGKQVLFLPAGEGNPRNGEGALIRLNSGAIMYAYTEYIGDDWHDHASAQISAYFSYDEGETWGDKRVLIEKGENDLNIMSVSLLRMQNGDIGMMYLRKRQEGEYQTCMPVFSRSSDEGETWSEAIECIKEKSYYIVNNDRIIRLKSGRIVVPVLDHNLFTPKEWVRTGYALYLLSDDDGYTWRIGKQNVQTPFSTAKRGLEEPGVYQHNDGTVWGWFRTHYGCQYQAFSNDDGETWSPIEPNLFFTGPASPMSVKKVGKYTVSIFNPVPMYFGREYRGGPGNDMVQKPRTPFICALSDCDGKTHDGESFTKAFYIEDDLDNCYCYCAIFEGEDYFLLAYYHSNGTGVALNSTKIVKVMYSEIEN